MSDGTRGTPVMAETSMKAFVLIAVLLMAAALGAKDAWAVLGEEPREGETLTQYLTPENLPVVFPGASNVGEVSGTPPAAPVFKDDALVGYLFSTWDVTRSKGFSNRPLISLVGVDLKGRITGVRLVYHSEPIAILGLKDDALHKFTENYRGHDITGGVDIVSELSSSVLGTGSFSQRSAPGGGTAVRVDAVSRATTTSVLMSDDGSGTHSPAITGVRLLPLSLWSNW
jgi:NosR/NirI family nitrous oxide reductase transcriptional regulator